MKPSSFTLVLDLASAATSRERHAFVRHLGGPVLVGRPPMLSGDDEWSYRTLSRRIVTDTREGDSLVLHDDDAVFVLKKAPGVPFAGTILIGRASSNDVCVEHPSVSKLQARVRVHADGTLHIVDAGSHNGTHVNERPLSTEEGHQLQEGDKVRFGACIFRFLSGERLHEFLNRFYS